MPTDIPFFPIVAAASAFAMVALISASFFTVDQRTAAIVQRLGRFGASLARERDRDDLNCVAAVHRELADCEEIPAALRVRLEAMSNGDRP